MRSLSMLRLAARAPCRSGPVTSTLGVVGSALGFELLQYQDTRTASPSHSPPPETRTSRDNREMLNRAALTVKPLEPFFQWAKSLDDTDLIPGEEGECTVYLVPYILSEQHEKDILKQVYAEIFERELFEWHTVEAEWPKKRTLAMFKKWFKYEFHSVVEDLCSYPILREDDA
jgi:hypothetical protein